MEALLDERLPSYWSYAVTREGRVFFVNDEHETTTWIHPTSKNVVQSGYLRHPKYPEVEFDLTNEGTPYFIDHHSSSTSWLPPQEKVKLRKESKRSTSPLRRIHSKRKSLKKKPIDVKRNRNSEVVQRGWLHRQESGIGPLKTWKKRWCVLSDLCLFIYKGPEEGDFVGSVLLPSYKITPGQKDSANKKFIFKAEHDNMKSEHFAGETVEEAEVWMEAMHLASMAVDGTLADSGDKILEQEKMLHSRSSNNFHSDLNDIPLNNAQILNDQCDEGNYKCKLTMFTPNEKDRLNNFGQQENLRDREELSFRSHIVSGNNVSNMNQTGQKNSQWKNCDVPTNEVLESSNFTRVKEWTEEQNKYREDLMTPRSFDEVPYASTPIEELNSESRRWMKTDEKNSFPTHAEDLSFSNTNASAHVYQSSNLTKHHKISLTRSEINSPKQNRTVMNRQSSKTNSEEQFSDSKVEIKTKESIKSSISSNTSNPIKSVTDDGPSRPIKQPDADISLSPEIFRKVDAFDVISWNKIHLKESHDLLDMFSQVSQQPPLNKERLVQVLIQLRRDQTCLHELLYCSMAKEDLDLNIQHKTIKCLIDENSIMIGHLENCLYGASNKNHILTIEKDENQAMPMAEKRDEPPKPRKRSTTQSTTHIETSTTDSNMQINPLLESIAIRNEEDYAKNQEIYQNPGQQTKHISNLGGGPFDNGHKLSQDPSMSQKPQEIIGKVNKNPMDEQKTNSPSFYNCDGSTFLETDLDSMRTVNIAKFSYGITPSDLNISSTIFPDELSHELKPSHAYLTSSNDHHQGNPTTPLSNRDPFLDQHKIANVRKNVSKNMLPNVIQKEGPRTELISKEQCKHSIVRLKSSPDNPSSSYFYMNYLRNELTDNKEYGPQTLKSNNFSESRQRTNSLTKDDAKEPKIHNLRSIKSTHNLNKDDVEDESHAGFRSRSNIRRLSGFFTPRPFYKSQSTNEVSKHNDDIQPIGKIEDIRNDQMLKNNNKDIQPWDVNESIDQCKKVLATHSPPEDQRCHVNLRQKERTENERKWKQNTISHRSGFSRQTAENKYLGE